MSLDSWFFVRLNFTQNAAVICTSISLYRFLSEIFPSGSWRFLQPRWRIKPDNSFRRCTISPLIGLCQPPPPSLHNHRSTSIKQIADKTTRQAPCSLVLPIITHLDHVNMAALPDHQTPAAIAVCPNPDQCTPVMFVVYVTVTNVKCPVIPVNWRPVIDDVWFIVRPR